jgi:hypothetical protein
VRTTLDEDVAARLRAEARRSGKPFREVVNEHLREALSSRRKDRGVEPPFRVHARDLGGLRPGLSLDHVGELFAATEGPTHR